MSEVKQHGIMQYWPSIVSIIAVVFYIGVAYGDSKTMKQKQDDLDARYTRQFTIINDQNTRIGVIEKWVEYQKGYDQAVKDFKLKK